MIVDRIHQLLEEDTRGWVPDENAIVNVVVVYGCEDVNVMTTLMLIYQELIRRVRVACTQAYRNDIQIAWPNGKLLEPFMDIAHAIENGTPFNLPTMAHQVAMFAVIDFIKYEVLVEESRLHETIDLMMGDLVDKYGNDDQFYAFVQSSEDIVQRRRERTDDLFEVRSEREDIKKCAPEWMSER